MGLGMKKALVIGINYYEGAAILSGCVNDAYNLKSVLERHADGTINFGVQLIVASDKGSSVTRAKLKENLRDLFSDDSDIALFYFSGHGYIESVGGYLITSDCRKGDDGLPMSEILTMANQSKAKNKIIILDCCHSGQMGSLVEIDDKAILTEGTTILTASTAKQFSQEANGVGIFTSLLVDALNGSAANLLGEITPGSVYAHIDQSLGPWEQRPIFKTSVKNFTTLRKVQAPIALEELRKLVFLFPSASYQFELDPSYEPESSEPDLENTDKFHTLQKLNRVNLVVPVDAEHMYHAAMNSKSCKLTVLGMHYWNLVKKNRI